MLLLDDIQILRILYLHLLICPFDILKVLEFHIKLVINWFESIDFNLIFLVHFGGLVLEISLHVDDDVFLLILVGGLDAFDSLG